jgi:hypothetical protein
MIRFATARARSFKSFNDSTVREASRQVSSTAFQFRARRGITMSGSDFPCSEFIEGCAPFKSSKPNLFLSFKMKRPGDIQ